MIAFAVWLSLCVGVCSLLYLIDGIVYNRRNDPLHIMRYITMWLLSFFSIASLLAWMGVFVQFLSDKGFF